ncbi:Histone deacetylase complex subunit CTI6 [Candida viswanathii]|uniref:Histone deacetylase complex subunit CTI6 n=1 Tax=Candida viswanathii TaxID=5486 RepID=A0A367XL31_9ASCO|nr:Histone deacetylase complex subunit CTI6 [Candida viswanathii]
MSRRAGRRGYNSDTATQLSHEEEEEEIEELVEEEEDEEDDNEVTRCICGKDELTNDSINDELASFLKRNYKIDIDQGLFILCESCSVWQHGYCVGLFENNDVPDKYWCELCKPELHILLKHDGYSKRTLYKPVNDKRKKLEQMTFNETIDNAKRKPKNERASPQATGAQKEKRKERRHHHHHSNIHDEGDDDYDEQLKRALRESARESGIKVSDAETNENSQASEVKVETEHTKRSSKDSADESTDSLKKRRTNEPEDHEPKRPKVERAGKSSGTDNESSIETGPAATEGEEDAEQRDSEPKGKSNSSRVAKRKKKTPPRSSASSSSASGRATSKKSRESSVENNPVPTLTKEELIQQPAKPRYVNDNSSIFELRKRTIAILEWLGRSQLELEEEKQQKLQLFSFIGDDGDGDDENAQHREAAQKDALELRSTFDENLLQMEKLTERILAWQDKFGKYAV